MKKSKTIVLTGGGTLGSVVPLLALAESLPEYNYKWIGTVDGPERDIVEEAGLEFSGLRSGKLRRYFSWKNFTDPFLSLFAFVQAYHLLKKWQVDLIISAGSFVSVPVVWAAKFLGVKVLIHQLDYQAGLANKLSAIVADVVAVTWEKSLKDYDSKAVWTGSMVRSRLHDSAKQENKQTLFSDFGFQDKLPVILIAGGGTGALALNVLAPELARLLEGEFNVLHLCGKNKTSPNTNTKNYNQIEFLAQSDMARALFLADVVITRAGMSALLELSYLAKPSIVIPMPNSHQELNAKILNEAQAAIVLPQLDLTANKLKTAIKKISTNHELAELISKNIQKVLRSNSGELQAIISDLLSS